MGLCSIFNSYFVLEGWGGTPGEDTPEDNAAQTEKLKLD